MAPFEANIAISAARAAVWTWRRSSQRLDIEAEASGPFALLSGEWSLPDFLAQLEGLSRPGFEQITNSVEPGLAIDETMTLADGATARVIGAVIDSQTVRGLIFAESFGPIVELAEVGDLQPVYQTIWRADNGAVAGFEALARWRSESGALIGPDELETSGRTADWGRVAPLMLDAAAKALAHFRAVAGDVFMQVNLSAAEIASPDLVRKAEQAIKSCGLPRDVLRLELTEQAALRDSDRALGALAAFRAAGAALVLDDFGAGHSSLVWLADIPADGLKLDHKLTSMMSRPRGRRIIEAIVNLAHDLGMRVTAEGVETVEQAEQLRAVGCDFLQGFLHGAPKTETDMLAELAMLIKRQSASMQ